MRGKSFFSNQVPFRDVGCKRLLYCVDHDCGVQQSSTVILYCRILPYHVCYSALGDTCLTTVVSAVLCCENNVQYCTVQNS
jgi:hypothetical protein